MIAIEEEFGLLLGAGTPAEQGKALEPVLNTHGPAIHKRIVRVLTPKIGSELAEQFADEVYSDVWENVREAAERGKFEDKSPSAALRYIHGIVKNSIREALRATGRRERFVAVQEPTELDKIVSAEPRFDALAQELWNCVQKLSLRQRQVFEVTFNSYKSPPTSKEIGTLLGITDATVRGYQDGGREKLADCMRRKGFAAEIASLGGRNG